MRMIQKYFNIRPENHGGARDEVSAPSVAKFFAKHVASVSLGGFCQVSFIEGAFAVLWFIHFLHTAHIFGSISLAGLVRFVSRAWESPPHAVVKTARNEQPLDYHYRYPFRGPKKAGKTHHDRVKEVTSRRGGVIAAKLSGHFGSGKMRHCHDRSERLSKRAPCRQAQRVPPTVRGGARCGRRGDIVCFVISANVCSRLCNSARRH